MSESSGHWDGAIQGDAKLVTIAQDGIGYRFANRRYQSFWVDRMARALFNGSGNRGVLRNRGDELEVSATAGHSPVVIGSGAAVIEGLIYENTAPIEREIATPTLFPRQDRVVVRRDWTAQTARVCILTGKEGGGPPALTQSSAPDGQGIYDVPLATLLVQLDGAIVVTDERQYCQFSLGASHGQVPSSTLSDGAIEPRHRAVTTRQLFFGAGDLQPNVASSSFAHTWTLAYDTRLYRGSYYRIYYCTESYLTADANVPAWGGAANYEAWRVQGSGSNKGLYLSFRLPTDYAYGFPEVYVWLICNLTVSWSFEVRFAYQYNVRRYYLTPSSWDYSAIGPGTYLVQTVTLSPTVHQVRRISMGAMQAPLRSSQSNALDPESLFHAYVAVYNSSGTEDLSIAGVELIYLGIT